jgi:hypothetical protein
MKIAIIIALISLCAVSATFMESKVNLLNKYINLHQKFYEPKKILKNFLKLI